MGLIVKRCFANGMFLPGGHLDFSITQTWRSVLSCLCVCDPIKGPWGHRRGKRKRLGSGWHCFPGVEPRQTQPRRRHLLVGQDTQERTSGSRLFLPSFSLMPFALRQQVTSTDIHCPLNTEQSFMTTSYHPLSPLPPLLLQIFFKYLLCTSNDARNLEDVFLSMLRILS